MLARVVCMPSLGQEEERKGGCKVDRKGGMDIQAQNKYNKCMASKYVREHNFIKAVLFCSWKAGFCHVFPQAYQRLCTFDNDIHI